MDIDKRHEIFERDNWTCQNCGKNIEVDKMQIAHRIRQDASARGTTTIKMVREFWQKNFNETITKKYAKEKIIDNSLNITTVCSLGCNGVFNIYFRPLEVENLLNRIYEDLNR